MENETLLTPEEIVLQGGKDSFFKRFLFGVLYGLAIIVPGISGAAVSIIFKLYDQLLFAVSNLFKKFKKCFLYLLPIGLGAIAGFLFGFFLIQRLLDLIPFSIVLLFAGLMIGSFPAVLAEIKGNPKSGKNTALFVVGLLVPILLLCLTLGLNFSSIQAEASGEVVASDPNAFFGSFPLWMLLLSLPIGFVVGLTQVVPGMSASAFLMMIGWFKPLMGCVHFEYMKENPKVFLLILIMVVGFFAGFFLTSKFIDVALKKNRASTYQVIVGLSLGSILTMFINPEVFPIYLSWANNGIVGTAGLVDIILAAPLLILGLVSSYALVRYERKKLHG